MKPTLPTLILTLTLSASGAARAATTNSYYSGDTSGSTGAFLSSVFDMNAGTINSAYTGWMAANGYTYGDVLIAPPADAGFTGPGRAGTDGFFNQIVGITTIPQMRINAMVTGGMGDLKFDLGSGQVFNYEVIGDDVTEFQVTMTYLGVPHFRPGDNLSPGFTGRYSFPYGGPQTNHRGWLGRYNQSSPDFGDLTISAVDINPLTLVQTPHVFDVGTGSTGGGSGVVGAGEQGDFYEGHFPSTPGIPLIPTLNAGGLSATLSGADNTLLNQNGTADIPTGSAGIFFHNGSDLGELLHSVTFTLNKPDGSAFADGTEFTMTFDAMAPFIPEPSRVVLLMMGAVGIILRRRRVASRLNLNPNSVSMKSFLLFSLGLLALSPPVNAALIAQYGFNENTGPWSVDTDPNMIASDFTATPTVSLGSSGFGQTEGTRWIAVNSAEVNQFPDLTAVNPMVADIVGSFSLTAPAGQKVMLDATDSVQFDFAMGDFETNGNASSAETVLFVSDDSAFSNILASSAPQFLTKERTNGSLSGSQTFATDITINSPVMGTSLYFGVAIISDDGNDGDSSARFDNIRVNGDLVAIPEPSRLLLGLIGLWAIALRRTRGVR